MDPARRGLRAEIGGVERRIPLGKVDYAYPRVRREPPHRSKEIVRRHPGRPGAGGRWKLRVVDYVDVAVDHQRIAMRDMVERAVDGMGDAAVAARRPWLTTRLPAAIASSCIARAVGEARQTDLRDIGAGQPVLDQARAPGCRCSGPRSRSRMSKCASSVMRPISSSAPPMPGCSGIGGALDEIGLITLDAHFDMRELDEGLSNGNPVRALMEDGLPGKNIAQIGLASFANS